MQRWLTSTYGFFFIHAGEMDESVVCELQEDLRGMVFTGPGVVSDVVRHGTTEMHCLTMGTC